MGLGRGCSAGLQDLQGKANFLDQCLMVYWWFIHIYTSYFGSYWDLWGFIGCTTLPRLRFSVKNSGASSNSGRFQQLWDSTEPAKDWEFTGRGPWRSNKIMGAWIAKSKTWDNLVKPLGQNDQKPSAPLGLPFIQVLHHTDLKTGQWLATQHPEICKLPSCVDAGDSKPGTSTFSCHDSIMV